MFNTNNHYPNEITKENTIKEVIHKSISPDKVVDMYNKIKSEICLSYINKSNSFEIKLFNIRNSNDNFGCEIYGIYLLNGVSNTFQFNIELLGKEDIKNYVCKKIGEELSKTITNNLSKNFISDLTNITNKYT